MSAICDACDARDACEVRIGGALMAPVLTEPEGQANGNAQARPSKICSDGFKKHPIGVKKEAHRHEIDTKGN